MAAERMQINKSIVGVLVLLMVASAIGCASRPTSLGLRRAPTHWEHNVGEWYESWGRKDWGTGGYTMKVRIYSKDGSQLLCETDSYMPKNPKMNSQNLIRVAYSFVNPKLIPGHEEGQYDYLPHRFSYRLRTDDRQFRPISEKEAIRILRKWGILDKAQ